MFPCSRRFRTSTMFLYLVLWKKSCSKSHTREGVRLIQWLSLTNVPKSVSFMLVLYEGRNTLMMNFRPGQTTNNSSNKWQIFIRNLYGRFAASSEFIKRIQRSLQSVIQTHSLFPVVFLSALFPHCVRRWSNLMCPTLSITLSLSTEYRSPHLTLASTYRVQTGM